MHTSVTEKTTTTNLVTADAEIASAGPVSNFPLISNFFSSAAPKENLSILKFLGKPVPLLVSEFTSSAVPTQFPVQKIPYDIISNPIYKSKLQGFFGFRATTVLTLQVNAERFQQGRYILSAVPCGGAFYGNKTIEHVNGHTATLVQRTQLPRVEIDLNTETTAVLRLPFNSADDFYPLQQYGASGPIWYSVRIFPYSPLDSVAGALTAKFTLWGHLEDVELIGQSITLQSVCDIPTHLYDPNCIEWQGVTSTTVKKGQKKESTSMAEAKSAGVGPISSITSKISKAANILTVIPIIGAYMTPVSWAADIATSVAQVFGWSAPKSMAAVTKTFPTAFSYATCVDKVDLSQPLAGSVKNEVARFPGLTPTDKDEMSISYLAGISAYCGTAAIFAGSALEGALISRFNVGLYPFNSPYSTVNAAGFNIIHYSPAQLVAQTFKLWRGSIWFRLKFVKTEYHAGRMSINFNPSVKLNVGPAVSDATAPYLHRDIINIQDMTEYSFCVPYISSQPYLNTDRNNFPLYGYIELRVVDPLVYPSTVPPNIQILIESWMGDDSEFAVPYLNTMIIGDTIQLQSAIGDMIMTKPTTVPAQVAIGERILSLRSLVKRFYPLPLVNDPTNPSNLSARYVLPFGWEKNYIDGVYQTNAHYADLYALLCSMFTYSRGGTRFKMSSTSGVDVAVLVTSKENFTVPAIEGYAPTATLPALKETFRACGMYNYARLDSTQARLLEVEVPQYHTQHSRINHMHSASEGYQYDYYVPNDDGRLTPNYLLIQTAVDQDYADPAAVLAAYRFFFRAGADDADFSFFISVPPMSQNAAAP